MFVALSLVIFSTLVLVLSAINDAWSDFVVIGFAIFSASLFILFRAVFARIRKLKPKYIVIDGSNVMYWHDGVPSVDSVREIVDQLTRLQFLPCIVFDANAGYLLSGRYQNNRALAKALGVPDKQVTVVHRGTQADPMILDFARTLDAKIVSNDRFRDWIAAYPEVLRQGHLIKGGDSADGLWLARDQLQ
ncbi:NYN domain-containing protein [Epibacterium ulvae]|uniref:NYN domain-containing protein n=1 Tax=Epibacterium ulvae TaxID=1156985 RepID=UPI0024917278|nr:hypothetical protein [Epibacterium ulvae]